MATATTMSGAAFDQLPNEESRDLELLQGELIEMPTGTPEHQLIILALASSLYQYFRRERSGGAIPDVEFAFGEDTRLRPDMAVLLGERWDSTNRKQTPIPLAPDIAVEVISPSERTVDSQRKVGIYLAAGTKEVWQFYPESRQVLVYKGAKSITPLDAEDTLSTPLLPGSEVSVLEIFEASN